MKNIMTDFFSQDAQQYDKFIVSARVFASSSTSNGNESKVSQNGEFIEILDDSTIQFFYDPTWIENSKKGLKHSPEEHYKKKENHPSHTHVNNNASTPVKSQKNGKSSHETPQKSSDIKATPNSSSKKTKSKLKLFKFHHIFDKHSTNHEIFFKTTTPLLREVKSGRNSCLIAYGSACKPEFHLL
jgi:hypothetical protein